MTFTSSRPLRAFVQLAYGFGGESWRKRWDKGEILGINEPQAYGYHRVQDEKTEIVYSEDKSENRLTKLMRLGVRFVLGFDLVHIWRNRASLLAADVVWTHTESQTLAVLALFRLVRPLRQPKLVGQAVWLVDHWKKQPWLRRVLFRWLLRGLDVLTLHSSLNCADARKLFPDLRVEQVLFGIRADDMCRPVLKTSDGPLRIVSLGNDVHRDWDTLAKAVSGLPDVSLQIASRSPAALKASEGHSHISVLQARTNDDLMALYNKADLVVVALTPNRHASGLTVIQEALIRGLAVVATDVGGLRDYFTDDMVCYVPPCDPRALQEAIQKLAAAPEMRQKMVLAGQERLKTAVNSVAYARRHVDLSYDLLDTVPDNSDLPAHPRIAIGIATSGRPVILARLLTDLKHQSVPPDRIVISYAKPSDIESLALDEWEEGQIELIQGLQGLPLQRNAILDRLADEDIILFLDDDFFPHPRYLEEMLRGFRSDERIVGLTGLVLADGAQGPGLPLEAAQSVNQKYRAPASEATIEDAFNTYGCNMAFRVRVLKRLGVRFDENLPLYAWYEDMDFSRALLPFGRIVRARGAVGVHLGNKTGKTSGLRLGYSQVINPIYLARKGTYPWDHALKSVGRHVLINSVKSLRPESWIDRKGRAHGNLLGLADVFRGRITPERASHITSGKISS